MLSPEAVAPRDVGFVSAYRGPTGFEWLVQGILGGTRKPGLYGAIEEDLDALQRVGTGTLITLLEANDLPQDTMDAYGLKNIWFPIDDMCAPPLEDAYETCLAVERIIARGSIAVYHCKAGLGRTGMMLAAHLVMRGGSGPEAIDYTRKRKGTWIQSQEQLDFLCEFEGYVGRRGGCPGW